MDEYSDFKKYFNKNFWKNFKEKTLNFDEISEEQKEDILNTIYREISNGKYSPSAPKKYLYDDKGSGVSRTIPVFEIKDYCVYYYCIKKLESKIAVNRIENTFGGWTLGGEMRLQEQVEIDRRKQEYDEYEDMLSKEYAISMSEYSFNPLAWRKAYGEYNEKIKATYLESSYPFVVELDISNFYDCIRLDLLEIWIREATEPDLGEIINLLFYFLNHWNRKTNLYNKQTVGIPQDALADCSRVLANFYLQKYDKYVYIACQKCECKYLRFADDQIIFGASIEKLKYLVFLISKKIVSFGLNVNQKKVIYRTSEELMEYRGFDLFDRINDREQDPEVVEETVSHFFSMEDEKLKAMKTGGLHFLRKIIFSNLNEITNENREKLINCFLEADFLRQANVATLSRIYKILGDEGYILISALKKLSVSSFHNIFHYKIIGFFKEINEDATEIQNRIKLLDLDEINTDLIQTYDNDSSAFIDVPF